MRLVAARRPQPRRPGGGEDLGRRSAHRFESTRWAPSTCAKRCAARAPSVVRNASRTSLRQARGVEVELAAGGGSARPAAGFERGKTRPLAYGDRQGVADQYVIDTPGYRAGTLTLRQSGIYGRGRWGSRSRAGWPGRHRRGGRASGVDLGDGRSSGPLWSAICSTLRGGEAGANGGDSPAGWSEVGGGSGNAVADRARRALEAVAGVSSTALEPCDPAIRRRWSAATAGRRSGRSGGVRARPSIRDRSWRAGFRRTRSFEDSSRRA